MTSSTNKILSIVLILVFISQGYSECTLKDLVVSQHQTGVKLQEKPEWNVTITNKCSCVQMNVILDCAGFKTVDHIDPSILRVLSVSCVVKDGESIYTDPIIFKYAWDESFALNPTSSQISCS